jgi:dTDP-4-dehydrorhamnose reductase
MRVLILGASGLLGKYLVREWQGDHVIGLNSKDIDIRDVSSVQRVVAEQRPHWIILAAAYTDVDGCEANQDLAFQTNTIGAINVAQAARQQGSRLLFLSSDYVFDGTKTTPYETDDVRHPRSVYGKSKAEAETRTAGSLPSTCIVRTSWVFGVGGKCFPDTILKLTSTRSEIDVVHDQRGCPTYARDLARAIFSLCVKDASGIVHVTNAGDCTWFEFACEIVRQAGLTTVVRPTTTEKFPRPAPRPRYSVLSPNSLQKYGVPMPPWRDAVADYLAERGTRN